MCKPIKHGVTNYALVFSKSAYLYRWRWHLGKGASPAAKGQPTGSAANDPLALLAPTSPYRPSRWGFWRRGDRKHSLPLW